jgi:Fe-S cluster assembly protein SufD
MNQLIADSFSAFKNKFPNSGGLGRAREMGYQRFLDTGLPDRKREDWHYSSVKTLAEQKFELALLRPVASLPQKSELRLLNSDFYNLVFVDGRLIEDYSDLKALQVEVKVGALSDSRLQHSENDISDFSAMNLSFAEQGCEIELPAEGKLAKPLQILSHVTGVQMMTHPRIHIKVGSRAKLTLMESFSGTANSYLQNSICTLEVGDSAKLEYVRILADHKESFNVGSTDVNLAKDSQFEALSFCVGSQFGRHNLRVNLTGVGGSAQVYGLTLGAGQQHMDHSTLIDHQVGGGTTLQLYKSVLNHTARSVFTGKVIIRKDAQKANSEQLNNNLLLSSQAEADSRPQLEILADDVKATHGSTVGQLNEEELFYLLSRAIPREQALEMLSLGFIQELVFKVSDIRVQKFLSDILVRAYREGVSL